MGLKLIRSLSLGVGFIFGNAFAAHIAVIDSGVDYKHPELTNNMWVNQSNPVQTVDADGKIYKDDLNGWNFAEQNNEVIDYRFLGKFSEDCTKIFHVQAKILNGTATSAEKAWYKAKKEDPEFLKELNTFGNFVHGTHVAGISSKNVKPSRIVAMKLLPTGTPKVASIAALDHEAKTTNDEEREDLNNPTVHLYLTMIANRQATSLATVGKYVAATHSLVANGSFGISVASAISALKPLLKTLLGHEPTDAETKSYVDYFMDKLVTASKAFPQASQKTLFVFAAGNDGANNDVVHASPANVKTENTIAVAATNGLTSLAVFSNYGEKNVEVAAPGVAIESSVPGDGTLPMSGTSMAAPFVTRAAGEVVDANSALTPLEIKRILMGTVDVKPFLIAKVSSSGIVNPERAVRAALLSRDMNLASAIAQAKLDIKDQVSKPVPPGIGVQDILVLPLPTLWL